MRTSRKLRAIALLLALCSIFTFVMTSCSKEEPDDDDKDDEKLEDPVYMKGHDQYLDYTFEIDMEGAHYLLSSGDLDSYIDSGLKPNNQIKAEGAALSGFWENQVSTPSLHFANVPKDITGYKALVMNVYSENANGAGFTLCLNCQYSESEKKNAYFKYAGVIDWTGWKQFIIPINELYNAYGADPTKVASIIWNASGWSNTPKADSKLYFDSVFFSTGMKYSYTVDIETLGDYNYDHVIDTLVDVILGGVSLDKADENVKPQLESYIKQAKSASESMNATGDPWNYDMTTTAGITSQYSRILQMARAYAIEGSEYYHSTALMNQIRKAMQYMHTKYYNDKSANSYPKRNNWWDWEIGSAQHIVNILMLCREGFTQAQIDIFLDPVNRYVPLPSMTMANLVDVAYVCVAASALQKDALRMVQSRNKLDECMGFVKAGDGFYHDGSFVQHTHIAYTGSYGPIMLEALSKIILAVNDTCFHVKDELLNEQYSWAVNSFVPLMYHGAFYGLVRGRSICRTSTDVSLGGTAVRGMLRMTKYVKPDQANVLKGILKEYIEYNDAYYIASLGPYDQMLYKELKADTSIGARVQYEMVKMFALMDRAIASLTDYGVGISLSSSRIAKYEAINEENGKGWYTGDGMLYIYTTVDDYNPEYWKNVNYYRIPGTTVTTAPRQNVNISSGNTLSKYDFVGGSYLDKSMAVAMQFESATDKMKTSGMLNSSLNGKKAWFIFDDEVVCLGAGINSSDSYNTETIIENRRLPLTEKFYANGEKVQNGAGTLQNCNSIWFSSLGGIYMPESTNVSFNRTTGSVSFLELYIDHGKKVTNGTYSYVLLPTMTLDESNAYAANPDVEILSNTADVQAAKDKSSNTTGYIFWKAGTFDGVTVSAPCSVIVSGNKVAISDPSMNLTSLTVKINGQEFTCAPADGQTYNFTLNG